MKATILIEKEFDLKTLHVRAGARYWEDATVNGVEDETGELIPFREGNMWCPVIDIETGVILGWPEGTTAQIHYKVCDNGQYSIKDVNSKEALYREGYVPNCLSPKESGYGDYIILDIDASGKIDGWKIDLYDFQEED